MGSKQHTGWQFIDDQGTFELKNARQNSYLYFPLVNHAGMMSSITPTLNGDAKLDQNSFLLLPVSVEDLHNTRSARNFWVRINGEPWSVTGNSAAQIAQHAFELDEEIVLQAGFLWHSITNRHPSTGLTATVVNFVPDNDDAVELMQITLTNKGDEALEIVPVAAIPIYARSADNIRDHRHVTALLNRTTCHPFGVVVKPTMSFDERGHTENHTRYAVLGVDAKGNPPMSFSPLVEDFIGEGGCLEWPRTIVEDSPELYLENCIFEGFESIGGLHFSPVILQPGETQHYILILGILKGDTDLSDLVERYGSVEKFSKHLASTRNDWLRKSAMLKFNHQDQRLDGWLQWVSMQPTFRRIMGNSFLPYHDYGRGGHGWRDLWQDLLALMNTEQAEIDRFLISNFAGVRMDGSNATIVGTEPGEFKADRNSIPRVWMDHGAWPLLTTKRYLDLTGELHLLLEEQTYFKDHLTHRSQKIDPLWQPEDGTVLRSLSGEIIKGTILEHLLVQHLTAFFNVGEHNLLKLEGGDWNDGLDMAVERGESVAFSAMYAGNLRIISELCLALANQGMTEVSLAVELLALLDQVGEPVDYDLINEKQTRLQAYFDSVSGKLSGKKIDISLDNLSTDLKAKSHWLSNHIQQQEWVVDQQGRGWFNGYYDNLGQRVEGEYPQGVRMTLTGQVFPLMAGIATDSQSQQMVKAAEHYLFDPNLHGYRLNTNFGEDVPELGRAFAFAYGHKENGAVFSHMAVMYAYALYQQGYAEKGWQILEGLYTQSQDFIHSRIYPGIPEYFDPHGRGMYPYLTGSAAWFVFTLLTESFGVKGQLGDLYLAPKLVSAQFAHSDELSVKTTFADKQITLIYRNPLHLSYGSYMLGNISVNGKEGEIDADAVSVLFSRKKISTWPSQVEIVIDLIERHLPG